MKVILLVSTFLASAWTFVPLPAFFGPPGYPGHQSGHHPGQGAYGVLLGHHHAFGHLGNGHHGALHHNHNFARAHGGANVQHEEFHTATHHKYNKEHHEIKHKADKGLEAKSHSHYADAHGGAKNEGGHQQYSDKGGEGKEVGHVSGRGPHGAHDSKHSSHHNAHSKHGHAGHTLQAAHGAHKAGQYDGVHKDGAFVNHHEIINKEYEDYDHHEAKKQFNKNHKFDTGHGGGAAKGQGYGAYGQNTGGILTHNNHHGYNNAYGYGAHGAGNLHASHQGKHGGFSGQHNTAHGLNGAANKGKADENNYYHSVKRRLRKEEHEVKHEDGKDNDDFGGHFIQAGHHNHKAAKHQAAAASVKDSAYQHAAKHQSHTPHVHHGYPYHHLLT